MMRRLFLIALLMVAASTMSRAEVSEGIGKDTIANTTHKKQIGKKIGLMLGIVGKPVAIGDSGNSKGNAYKKVKYSVSHPTSDSYSISVASETFKGDDKTEEIIGMDLIVDIEKEQDFCLRLVYAGGKDRVIPEGHKFLIRTGNGKVYKGVTNESYSSESYLENDNKYNPLTYQLVSARAVTKYSPIIASFIFENQAMDDIQEFGIVKIRKYYSDGRYKDTEFVGKNWVKAHKILANMIYTLKDASLAAPAYFESQKNQPVEETVESEF